MSVQSLHFTLCLRTDLEEGRLQDPENDDKPMKAPTRRQCDTRVKQAQLLFNPDFCEWDELVQKTGEKKAKEI